jgi:hypothetical protein
MKIPFNWGSGIALTYTTFALATSGFVAFAIGRPVDLVSTDYYARSLQLDRHLKAQRNAEALGRALSIELSSQRTLRIALPVDQALTARGTVTLYRASNARADRHVPLAPDAWGRQEIALNDVASGHWLVQLEWSGGDADYYAQRSVVVR